MSAPHRPTFTFTAADLDRHAARIHPVEMEAGRMYLAGYSQNATAQELGCTQPAVHYRLLALVRRLELLDRMPPFKREDFEADLTGVLSPQELESFLAYWATPSCVEVARKLDLAVKTSRDRMARVRRKIAAQAAQNPRFERYAILLDFLTENSQRLHSFTVRDWASIPA